MPFRVWLLSLSVFSRFIHVTACFRPSFIFHLIGDHILFLHPLVDGYFGYQPFLGTVSGAYMNVQVQISLRM